MEENKVISIAMPPDLLEKLDAHATKQGRTRAGQIRFLCDQCVSQTEQPSTKPAEAVASVEI